MANPAVELEHFMCRVEAKDLERAATEKKYFYFFLSTTIIEFSKNEEFSPTVARTKHRFCQRPG